MPQENRVELADGSSVEYDFLVIATGPKLAFDEIQGLGPEGHTHSVCHVGHAGPSGEFWKGFVQEPVPIGISEGMMSMLLNGRHFKMDDVQEFEKIKLNTLQVLEIFHAHDMKGGAAAGGEHGGEHGRHG